jgi:hypothetical protein
VTPAKLVKRAYEAGLKLTDHGDVLRVRGLEPRPDDLLGALREHKREVLDYLRQIGIGTARPPAPERLCPSCGGGLQPGDPDSSFCDACKWTFKHLAPRRVQ